MSQQIAKGLQERKDWIGIRWAAEDDMIYGRETRLLDYACGTGSVTKAIGPWTTHIRGLDVSENMVQLFNDTAKASGLTPDRVQAVVGDLLADEVDEKFKAEEWWNFDIAVIGLGFHHFENPVRAVQRLTERLKPGTGVLLIIDFLPFDRDDEGAQKAAQHTYVTFLDLPLRLLTGHQSIKHGGFARTNMEKLYQLAKLEKFSFSVMEEPVEMFSKDGTSSKRTVFFARGRREPTTWGKLGNWLSGIQNTAGTQFSMAPGEGMSGKLSHTGGRSTGFN
jgi:SAM-dependent methyltransferase